MSHFDFPEWPNGEDGTVLMDIVIDKTVNDAFILFHGGETEYRVRHCDFADHHLRRVCTVAQEPGHCLCLVEVGVCLSVYEREREWLVCLAESMVALCIQRISTR